MQYCRLEQRSSIQVKFRYSKHLKIRLELRHIAANLPSQVFENADEKFRDAETGHFIAVKKVLIYNAQREVMVAYEEEGDIAVLLTIHPLKKGQKEGRIRTGRWQRL